MKKIPSSIESLKPSSFHIAPLWKQKTQPLVHMLCEAFYKGEMSYKKDLASKLVTENLLGLGAPLTPN